MSETYDTLIEPAWKPVEADEAPLGTRVRIWEVNRGTEAEMQRVGKQLRDNLAKHVTRKYPLELWVFALAKSTDPWGGYEIYAEYHGVVSTVQVRGQWQARRRKQRRVSRAR